MPLPKRAERLQVRDAIEKFLQRSLEYRVAATRCKEQRQAGSKLHRIQVTEDLAGGPTIYIEQQLYTFGEPPPENRVLEIGMCFLDRRYCITLRHLAATEPCYLRKDEPDPVTGLPSLPQFIHDAGVNGFLGIDEALQVVRVVCHGDGYGGRGSRVARRALGKAAN